MNPSYNPIPIDSISSYTVDKFSPPTPQVEGADTFLEEASKVMKQRAAQRDKAGGERSMEATVAMFNAATGANISVEDGWLFMICLKCIRGRQGFYNRDDFVDGSAYFSLMGESASENMPRKS